MSGWPRPNVERHPQLATTTPVTPAGPDFLSADDIHYGLLDQAREDRRVDWEESEPDVVDRVEDLDIPLIAIVWDAAWSAALDANASLGES